MKVSYAKPSKCTNIGAWLLHETRDFLRIFGVEFDWRVYRVYDDYGARTILMNKQQAKDYAEIFGGTMRREK